MVMDGYFVDFVWLRLKRLKNTSRGRCYSHFPKRWPRLSEQLSRFLKWKPDGVEIRRGSSVNAFYATCRSAGRNCQ